MATDLTIIQGGAVPTMSSVKGVSYDELVKRMEEEEAFTSMFPGDQYSFKKGHWIKGWGDNKEVVDKLFREKSIVINAANVNFAWRMFAEQGNGKKRPVYLAFANPALGEKLPDRKTLGHLDKALWEEMEYQGKIKQQDPIGKIAMLPFRFDGEKTVHHLMIESWSAIKAVQDFMKKFGMEGRKHMGKLPVVNLDVKLEEHWDDPTVTFDVPVFDIADWDAPIAEDEPDGSVKVNAQAEIPTDGGVTSSARVAKQVGEIQDNAIKSANVEIARNTEIVKGVQNGGEPEVWGGAEPEKVLETVGGNVNQLGGNGGSRRGAAKATSSRRGG
jgi:hypothetical protein